MSGHQTIIATGHLGADPVIRATQAGGAVTELRIAVTDTWRGRDGERVEHTEWLRIKAFGRTAELAGQYLRTGRLITVQGKLRTEKWQHSDGSDRYSTWIYADRIEFHGRREHAATAPEHQGRAPANPTPPDRSDEPWPDDDPF